MRPTEGELFAPSDVADRLRIPTSTLRTYAAEFGHLLSAEAGGGAPADRRPRRHRRYSADDLAVLGRAKELLALGLSYQAVRAQLGELDAVPLKPLAPRRPPRPRSPSPRNDRASRADPPGETISVAPPSSETPSAAIAELAVALAELGRQVAGLSDLTVAGFEELRGRLEHQTVLLARLDRRVGVLNDDLARLCPPDAGPESRAPQDAATPPTRHWWSRFWPRSDFG